MPKWDDLVEATRQHAPHFVLIPGDILPKASGADMFSFQRDFIKRRLQKLLKSMTETGAEVLLYFGNDDIHHLEPGLDKLQEKGLCVNMNGRVHRSRGLAFVGMNKVRDHPWGYKHWNVPDGDFLIASDQKTRQGLTVSEDGEWEELEDLAAHLRAKPSISDELEALKLQLQPGEMRNSIWLVHQPPSGCGMDICGTGLQVGSPTVLKFAQDNQMLLGCSGHIHESPHQPHGRWMTRLGRTVWIQPGQVARELHYATVDLDKDLRVTDVEHSLCGH